MKALVVDDSRAMRAILSKHLRELGFDVHEAKSGIEGLTTLHKIGSPDLIMVDWNMPEMDGFEFLKRVRSESDYDEARIMMVTTESEMSQVELALEEGANEYLMKPFDREALLEKLLLLGIDPNEQAA
ncbi:MAG TPA: response regulator [Candidatus Udaeobacter sp.]|jgi:two-component system chemotaxis response regulator CheY|nr:response regulator [Candidatus Udaeobacter sp.]